MRSLPSRYSSPRVFFSFLLPLKLKSTGVEGREPPEPPIVMITSIFPSSSMSAAAVPCTSKNLICGSTDLNEPLALPQYHSALFPWLESTMSYQPSPSRSAIVAPSYLLHFATRLWFSARLWMPFERETSLKTSRGTLEAAKLTIPRVNPRNRHKTDGLQPIPKVTRQRLHGISRSFSSASEETPEPTAKFNALSSSPSLVHHLSTKTLRPLYSLNKACKPSTKQRREAVYHWKKK
mmetsp:Transcript_23721/g.93474  ORF Transcript_23721/g.93474 Transcript_23721/m.93474 type:complete len:236 (+) Transcript_23721:3365-4072(+)